jgi:hypothetical protein
MNFDATFSKTRRAQNATKFYFVSRENRVFQQNRPVLAVRSAAVSGEVLFPVVDHLVESYRAHHVALRRAVDTSDLVSSLPARNGQ